MIGLMVQATTTQRTAGASVTTPRQTSTATVKDLEYNYDDEYDDEENDSVDIEPTTTSTVPESRNVPSSTEKAVPSSTEVSAVSMNSGWLFWACMHSSRTDNRLPILVML